MQKYYIAKLEASASPGPKLVGVQFARRPPTFGVLYLDRLSGADQVKSEQSLKLAMLEVSSDNSAQLVTAREARLTGEASAPVVDFGPLDGQLLLEASHSNASTERHLRSSCFVLTQSGHLLAISLAAETIAPKLLLNLAASSNGRFLEFKVLRQPPDASDGLVADPQRTRVSLQLHLLSDKCYLYFLIALSSSELDCEAQLIGSYALESIATNGGLRFKTMLVLESGRSKSIVQLELSDGSRRFVDSKQAKCFHATASVAPPQWSQQLVLASSLPDQWQTILISYSSRKLTASSLSIPSQSLAEDVGADGELPGARSDPDGLLPAEPSFELEDCWTIDLDEIDGVRSALPDEDEDEAMQNRAHGCLCPVWSNPALETSGRSSSLASDADCDDLFGEHSGWPRYLLVMSGHHLLVYNFEQLSEMPFSVVYDRAFLELESGGGEPARVTVPQNQDKHIDVRVQPKLEHNFKLIGSQTSDSLFNLLFLSQRVRLRSAKCFNKLGLVVALTDQCHVLVFKLTSASILRTKDTLYQQTLLVSLRAHSLLADEAQRAERAIDQLREQIASLDTGQNRPTPVERADQLECQFAAHLRPHELVGGLYELELEWPRLISLRRALVISTARVSFLSSAITPSSSLVKSMEVGNYEDESDQHQDLEQELASSRAILLKLNSGETKDGAGAQLLRSKCSTKAWALVNMNTLASAGRTNGFLATGVSSKLTVQLILSDGQPIGGELKVFFVLERPVRALDGLKIAHRQDSGEMHTMAGVDTRKAPNKFHLKQLPVKPLHSYRLFKSIQDEFESCVSAKIEITGAFSDEQMFMWLNECLDMSPADLHQVKDDNSSRLTFCLDFRSRFTHCFVSLRLQQIEKSLNKLGIESDDLNAMNLLEQHIFKRATDDSIKLTKVDLKLASVDCLRQLIGKQRLNIDSYLSLVNKEMLAGETGDVNDGSNCRVNVENQVDLLVESLLGESDLQNMAITMELKQSTNWLQRSLRKDLEQIMLAPEGQYKLGEEPNHRLNQIDMLVSMMCDHIIGSLVDYDSLPANKTLKEMTSYMRVSLSAIIDAIRNDFSRKLEDTSSQQVKFASRILDEWLAIKGRCQ